MQDFLKLVKISKTLVDVFNNSEDSANGFNGLNKFFSVISGDYIGKLLLTKLNTKKDRVKAIYLAFFMYKKPNLKYVDYYRLINNLYVLEYETYVDETKIKVNCGNCDGDGEVECSTCDGDGELDCKVCDGDGTIECTTCWGSEVNTCDTCGGSGEVEGYDDEMEKCEECDGSGDVECEDCSGKGEHTCYECDGSGNRSCDDCNGYGTEYCGWCGGSGEEDSNDDYYDVYHISTIMLGDKMKEYIGQSIDADDFYDIENEFMYEKSFSNFSHTTQDTVDDTQRIFGMSDDFVYILSIGKLDDVEISAYNL